MKKILLFVLLLLITGMITSHFVLVRRPLNVILITIDTLRSDYLSCYNPKVIPTKNIDYIANHGVRFASAYCLIPITLPSHTTILTSHSPHELNLFNNGDVFDHHLPMITDFLQPKGFKTAAFVSLGVLKGEYGLRTGFDHYEDNFDAVNRHYKYANEVNELVLPWIEKEKKSRFFAWIHYSDPHEPYAPIDAPPDTEVRINGKLYNRIALSKKEKQVLHFIANPGETQIEFEALAGRAPLKVQLAESKRFLDRTITVVPEKAVELKFGDDWQDIKLKTGLDARYFAQKAVLTVVNPGKQPVQVSIRYSGGIWAQRLEETRRNYAAEVQFVDKHIGQLWQKLVQLGLDQKTMVVITSDHGEGLRTHGILGHVDRLWNEIIHVPLIVYYPHLGRQGSVATPLVNHLDVMPTILDLLRIPNHKPMEGQSLKHYISRSPIDWFFSKSVHRERTFAYTFKPEARENSFAITNGKFKVIHTPEKPVWQWEGFDLTNDPLEKRNLNKTDPAKFQSLADLKKWLESYQKDAETIHKSHKRPVLDENQQEMMKALGYIEQQTQP